MLAFTASAAIVPLSGSGWNDYIEILGQPGHKRELSWFDAVSEGYFRTMATPLLAGRDFNDHDTTSAPEVAIVNQQFAAKFLKGAMAQVKRTVQQVNPDLSLEFQVFKTQVRDSLLRERLMATLSGFFGSLAVVLTKSGCASRLAPAAPHPPLDPSRSRHPAPHRSVLRSRSPREIT